VRRLGLGEGALLGVLAAWSLVPLAAGLVHLAANGGSLSGVDGIGALDHLQYMAWIRDAGEHGLVANRFDLAHDDAVYLQPMWLLSGLAWRAGASVQLAFLLWKPICVAVLLAGCAAYVRRFVDGRGARVAALALALFFFPPSAPLMAWTGVGSDTGKSIGDLLGYELSPATYLWGYVQTAIAVGLMPVFLLCAERLVEPAARPARLYAAGAAAAGLAVSWVHPWQGLVLLAVVGAVALLDLVRRPAGAGGEHWGRRRLALAVPVLATAAPLAYFAVLSRTDTAWRAGREELGVPHYWGWLALALAPLVLLAAAGAWRGAPRSAGERMLLAWPVATLVVYALLDRSFFFNVLSGMTIPLAVLAVRSAERLRAGLRGRAWTGLAAAAVLALTVPGLAHAVDELREGIDGGGAPHYLRDGEADALAYLDRSPRGGPVLSRVYLGAAVPGFTGRRTYVGHQSWTPDFERRVAETEALFGARLAPARVRALVRSTRAAFLLQDCEVRRDLRPALGPLVERVRRFGCARVYELRTPS
jgi:hypothetical protein